ncbi:ABC transporter ATP-binding protein [Cryobacterium sp. 5B3]|uniref:ABC transporter ATP-binding protein n=1 Tax=Cryobacterium sp. 5B3 TaxID=3048586 RepID=UPI002AB5918D|nr:MULTISPECIES: ABC transporter ATP-binding protein [unclassified Cryobacterium]MDY7542719.1 ABC transporter ATP-binding protein [Cryobacterium sp. 5B3]MEB0266355.1 ABC transporter ATP-binding protein [Cryobacterium sp. 10I5]MEB0274768.1 ABC transporter ATP-binding protein [Cryobacterium sp. 5B3]
MLPYLLEHKKVLSVVVVLSILGALASLAQPLLVSQVITVVQQNQPLGALVWGLVALVVVSGLISGYQHYLLQRTGEGVVLSSRRKLIGRMLRLPISEFDTRRTGDLVSRVGSDTTLLRAVLTQGLVEAIGGSLTFLGALIAMLVIDPVLLGLTVLVIAASVVTVTLLSQRIRVASREAQEKVGALAASVERAISAIRTVRASNATEREIAAVDADATGAYRMGLKVAKISALVVPIAGIAMQVSFLVVLGVGGFRVASGQITVANLIAFILFLFLMILPLGQAFGAITSVNSALGALGRIQEIIDLPAEDQFDRDLFPLAITVGAANESVRPDAPAISFENVFFGYATQASAADAAVPADAASGDLSGAGSGAGSAAGSDSASAAGDSGVSPAELPGDAMPNALVTALVAPGVIEAMLAEPDLVDADLAAADRAAADRAAVDLAHAEQAAAHLAAAEHAAATMAAARPAAALAAESAAAANASARAAATAAASAEAAAEASAAMTAAVYAAATGTVSIAAVAAATSFAAPASDAVGEGLAAAQAGTDGRPDLTDDAPSATPSAIPTVTPSSGLSVSDVSETSGTVGTVSASAADSASDALAADSDPVAGAAHSVAGEDGPADTADPDNSAVGDLGSDPVESTSMAAAVTDSSEPRPVLRGVSFSAPRGLRTALVGPSGAGKSTILALIERFYDPNAGIVRLGGLDIRTLDRTALRSQIGYVEQDAPVLAGSLRDNLVLSAPDATDEECIAVLHAVNLGEVLERDPAGLGAAVGESGVMLSGGERQRLAIARALLAAPPILLLDESTSSLDGVNEQLMRAAIDAVAVDRTLIVIAHRLSTVVDSDQIVVLDHGRVIGTGTHSELVVSTPLYRDLAKHQLLV